jgi:hypothetical protein
MAAMKPMTAMVASGSATIPATTPAVAMATATAAGAGVLRRTGGACALAALATLTALATLAACDSEPEAAPPDPEPTRAAAGRRLIDHAAIVGGLTTDRHLVYSELNADGHSVAKVMPLDGGPAVTIATSSGTGKADLRFVIRGRVVFVWADRGNRSSSLTVWTAETGPVPRGSGVRPGRAAASADGKLIAYERDVTMMSANLVVGPVAGPDRMIATANAQDGTCWRDTDIASLGARMLVRYCPDGATAFTLRSVATDGTFVDLSPNVADARFAQNRAIWREPGGVLATTTDGVASVQLAATASDFTATRDLAHAAYLTADGAIYGLVADGSEPARVLAPAPEAKQLGALSPVGSAILYATQLEDRGPDHLAPYTDVRVGGAVGGAAGAPRVLVPGTTSCASCLADSFTPDGRYAMVIDPIDNTPALDGAGPIRVLDTADGSDVATFGQTIYNAYALPGGGGGTASPFLFVDAVRDEALVSGWIYGLTARTLDPDAEPVRIAAGAENFFLDRASGTVAVSFAGDDDIAGVWIWTP